MEYAEILVRHERAAAIITLNRPERLNAHTARMGDELTHAVQAADDNDAVRAIIVTGAGRGFCAGEDISGGSDTFRRDDAAPGEHLATRDHEFITAFLDCRKPIIAAINGPAIGVGSTMILPMDFRIASTEARFGFVFVKLGTVPESGATWLLPRLVGDGWARRWCLTGRLFDAAEALESGLVYKVAMPDELLDEALKLVDEIATATSPVAVAVTRQMLWRVPAMADPRQAFPLELKLFRDLNDGPDITEGIAAFLEKRPPRFTSKPSTQMPAAYPWWQEPPLACR